MSMWVIALRILWFWAMTASLGSCWGCWQEERVALLRIKANIPNFRSLPSWVDEENSNCCEWVGVECNSTTGRVIGLYLNDTRERDSGNWYFNASLFLSIEKLRKLDLSGNHLAGWMEHQGFDRLTNLSNLELLDLSGNVLNNISILPYLSGLSSLKSLYLSNNAMEGSLHSSFERLMGLSNLEVLDLSSNNLNRNSLTGVCELKNLQQLDLSQNTFEGPIPSCLGNLSSLQYLDLSYNLFSGNIAFSPFKSLTSLQYLSLSNNNFQIPSSFRTFDNNSKLEVLLGDNNNLVAETLSFNGASMFHPKVLILENCRPEKPHVAFLEFLHSQYDLRFIDLSNNNLGGAFPSWVLLNNTRLQYINLRNNTFTGHLNLPSHLNAHISVIDFSKNNIQGQISANLSSVFPNLKVLNLSKNELVGNINSCIKNMKSLKVLDLSNNNLSGIMPEHLGASCPSLWLLKLSSNNFSGQVSPKIALPSIQFLYLDGNNFTGEVPESLAKTFLVALDLSNNHFTGNLPRWMGNLRTLAELSMSRNHFQGAIPTEFCKLLFLWFLDLSENSLSGSIPSCFNSPIIRYIHLHKNSLQGPLGDAFCNSLNLVTLDLSENNLSGKVPNWIGNLSELSILLLKGNHFTGEVPVQLCLLRKIKIMDLSENNIFGSIPPCLSSIPFKGNFGTAKENIIVMPAKDDQDDALKSYITSKLEAHPILNIWSDGYPFMAAIDEIEFTTKMVSHSYKGKILNLMSGIDLSCNQLTGEIPVEIGNISMIHALNLSHNYLTGSIPTSFSNLKQLESLDLSYNNLSGRIPPRLIELNFLAVFKVAHNNLSGPIPDWKAQFGTFEESSYEGNPSLCGPPLPKNCEGRGTSQPTSNPTNGHKGEDTGFIDMDVFYISFIISYIIMLLGIVAALYINSYWRRAWLYYVEVCATRTYYFLVDHFPKFRFWSM